jgi:hypothetical protein
MDVSPTDMIVGKAPCHLMLRDYPLGRGGASRRKDSEQLNRHMAAVSRSGGLLHVSIIAWRENYQRERLILCSISRLKACPLYMASCQISVRYRPPKWMASIANNMPVMEAKNRRFRMTGRPTSTETRPTKMWC